MNEELLKLFDYIETFARERQKDIFAATRYSLEYPDRVEFSTFVIDRDGLNLEYTEKGRGSFYYHDITVPLKYVSNLEGWLKSLKND